MGSIVQKINDWTIRTTLKQHRMIMGREDRTYGDIRENIYICPRLIITIPICGFWYLFGMFSFVLCFSKLFQLPGMSRLPNTLIKVIMQSIYSVHLELMIILVNTIRALILLIWFELHTDFLNEGFTTGSMDGATVFKTLWILSQFVDGVRAISYMLKCISQESSTIAHTSLNFFLLNWERSQIWEKSFVAEKRRFILNWVKQFILRIF
jgi:hypothetical protein